MISAVHASFARPRAMAGAQSETETSLEFQKIQFRVQIDPYTSQRSISALPEQNRGLKHSVWDLSRGLPHWGLPYPPAPGGGLTKTGMTLVAERAPPHEILTNTVQLSTANRYPPSRCVSLTHSPAPRAPPPPTRRPPHHPIQRRQPDHDPRPPASSNSPPARNSNSLVNLSPR